MTECETIGCFAPQTHVVFWPGKTSRMCSRCQDRALRVAGHMGFVLDVEPIDSCRLAGGGGGREIPTLRGGSVYEDREP